MERCKWSPPFFALNPLKQKTNKTLTLFWVPERTLKKEESDFLVQRFPIQKREICFRMQCWKVKVKRKSLKPSIGKKSAQWSNATEPKIHRKFVAICLLRCWKMFHEVTTTCMLFSKKTGFCPEVCENQYHVGAQKQRLVSCLHQGWFSPRPNIVASNTHKMPIDDDVCAFSATGDSYGKARITGRDDSEILKMMIVVRDGRWHSFDVSLFWLKFCYFFSNLYKHTVLGRLA